MGATAPAIARDQIPVDLELVIALDVSTSMDREERRLQRDGFVAAFRDPEVIHAIQSGPKRRVAVSAMEWAGERRQDVIVDWHLITDAASAADFADALERRIPGRMPMGTAIGSAMLRAATLFGSDDYAGTRRVIDVSGDGINNRGEDPSQARDTLVARGITINGLPIVYKRLLEGVSIQDKDIFPPESLVDYFNDRVIGGPGAFVEPVLGLQQFDDAIRRKLLREIRGPNNLASLPEARTRRGTSRRTQAAEGALIAATTWPTAARSSADGPPR